MLYAIMKSNYKIWVYMQKTDAGKVMGMSLAERTKEKGISLKTIHVCLIVLALLVSCYLIYSTHRLSARFQDLSDATDRYLQVRSATTDLMDATDYLTEMVQRYTLDGDSSYLHSYFEEAFQTRRRENAILKISMYSEEDEAVEKLQNALNQSAKLMERDYYAMRMVAEATGLSPMPEELQDIELQPQHALLPAREKKEAAQHMVSDEDYYREKDKIRKKMRESLAELEQKTHDVQLASETKAKSDLRWVRIVTVVQAAAIMLITWLLAHLGITPIMKAAERLREDSTIPVMGAREFRYLAGTYNNMYDVYKKSVASLNFKANHDELTKAYNRAGYDLLLSSLDLSGAGFLLIDVDLFKGINDTYGHETGDRILQKVAGTLTRFFRSGDYVCRIGGDEFVVIMLQVNRGLRELIENKVTQINEALADTADGLPKISVSVGVAFGEDAEDPKQLYEHADLALYETKRRGRCGVSFYEPQNEK